MAKRRRKRITWSKIIFVSIGKALISPFRFLWWVCKHSYYGMAELFRKSRQASAKAAVEAKRPRSLPRYESIAVNETIDGKFESFEKKLETSDSTIGLILGARGSGKSAIGLRLLENIKTRTGKKCFAIGFNREDMPNWVDVVAGIEDLTNNSFVLIDEGGILFSSRKSMSDANTFLSDLLLIARHKNISVMFISQNSSNLEINAIRQADYLVLKKSSLLQKDFERQKIKDIYGNVEEGFKKHGLNKGLAFIYSDEFRGFVSNPLPSFWSEKVSKSFRRR